MQNIELRSIDDERQHTFNGIPLCFPYAEIVGDWKYELPQMGTCIGTNLKTGIASSVNTIHLLIILFWQIGIMKEVCK